MLSGEDRYLTLFEESIDAMYISTRDGRLLDVNQSFLGLFQYTREELKDLNVRELYSDPESRSEFQQKIEKEGSVREYGLKLQKKDRTYMDCLLTATVRVDDRGKIIGYHGIIRDITDRSREREALRKSEERFKDLFENANDIIYTHDLLGNITSVNPAATRVYHYTIEELVKLNIAHIIDPEYLPLVQQRIQEKIKGSQLRRPYDILTYTKKGRPIWLEVNTHVLQRDGKPIEVKNIARNITERRWAEEKVVAYQEQLRSLASELSVTEERERRRIALSLHDGVGQYLAMAKVKLGMLRDLLPESVLVTLNEINELIQEAGKNTRQLTFELSPPMLYEVGFVAAVDWLSEEFSKQYGIQIELQDDGEPKPMDDDIRVVLFTAVRELLVNVAKHAQARKAVISICREGGRINICVVDDGTGFESSKIELQAGSRGGFGLFSIRERLGHFGGYLEVQSELGHGSRINLVAPLSSGK